MTSTEKYITNEENHIIRVCDTSIIRVLLIFRSDIFFLYMSNEGGPRWPSGWQVLASTRSTSRVNIEAGPRQRHVWESNPEDTLETVHPLVVG